MGEADKDSGVRSIDHLGELVGRLHEMRAAFGRTGPFDVVLGPKMMLKRPTPESAERFIQMANELKTAGVTWATLNIAHPSRAAYIDLVQWFGEEVASRAR
jgi:hypothetical protein